MTKDFVVNITKLTKPVSQQGFGLILLLGTSKEVPYTLCSGVEEVSELFGAESVEYQITSRIFGQNPAPQTIAVKGILYDDVTGQPSDLTLALDELVEVNNDWYHLVCAENADDVITALSGWVDAQEMKLYWATTQNLTAVTALESEQTVVMYHDDEEAFVAEGLAAFAATTNPGEITFKFKTVNGVTEANITSTELSQLHTDGGFSYVRKMGVLQTTEGTTTSGEYIDVVMGAHFLKARIEEEIMYLAVNSKKIPYDNAGIGMLISAVDRVFKQGTRQGIILKDSDGNGAYTIDALTREDVSANDVANRVYNGLEAEAKLAGAIHAGTFSIILTY